MLKSLDFDGFRGMFGQKHSSLFYETGTIRSNITFTHTTKEVCLMKKILKNGWVDKLGRVYIIYTIEEIMEALTPRMKRLK